MGVIVVLLLVARIPKVRKYLANLSAKNKMKALLSKRGGLLDVFNFRRDNQQESSVYNSNDLES